MSSYFYNQIDKNTSNAGLLESLEYYAEENKKIIYVVNRPLTDLKYSYDYSDVLIILSPKNKIFFVNIGTEIDRFNNYVEDVTEDIGSISDKYLYKEILGRPRKWKEQLIRKDLGPEDFKSLDQLFQDNQITDGLEKKKVELVISLFIGSINDIERVKGEVPITLLDKVKQKIQLFDGDQTRFVYQKINKSRIIIQGLSGTGKTELLLHKLKELYTKDESSRIYFTCHNRILADNLKKRIPSFFNFMKVEQQIEWEERLWCTNAWGSHSFPNSGAYRYICAFYQIPFFSYSFQMSFSIACKNAIKDIKAKYKEDKLPKAFTYMLIDESQDFDENFFELCELVTEKNIYIAGDIFQSIFDEKISNSIDPDFLLGKCYRTDPKTLMFAHGLGMGLFEESKLRWLEEKEWKDCGYQVSVDENSKFHLKREPLRRFEDVEDYESIEIVGIKEKISTNVINILKTIKEEHPTVSPEDIGIIMIDTNKQIYSLADTLEISIQQEFGWEVNKAYESKEKTQNQIFISNRNNVKGLEFPFVLCITRKLTDNPTYRNSLYTMLTRSFIKSYLVIPDNEISGLSEGMKTGLQEIIDKKEMIIIEPSEEEKELIRTRFNSKVSKMSHYDLMISIFKKLKIDKKHHQKLLTATHQLEMIEKDEETLFEFVRDNYKYLN